MTLPRVLAWCSLKVTSSDFHSELIFTTFFNCPLSSIFFSFPFTSLSNDPVIGPSFTAYLSHHTVTWQWNLIRAKERQGEIARCVSSLLLICCWTLITTLYIQLLPSYILWALHQKQWRPHFPLIISHTTAEHGWIQWEENARRYLENKTCGAKESKRRVGWVIERQGVTTQEAR